MKRHYLFSLALLLLISFLLCSPALLQNYENAALAAPPDLVREEIRRQLGGLGGKLFETRIKGWVLCNHEYRQLPELSEKVLMFPPFTDKEAQVQMHRGQVQNSLQAEIAVSENDAVCTLALHSSILPVNGSETYKTWVSMEVVLNSDSTALEGRIFEEVKDILGQFGDNPFVGTTYTAVIPGRLQKAEMERIGRKVFSGLDATITEMSADAEWISLTGYSSLIGGGLTSEQGCFNLNAALRYRSYEGSTYILLGTPVILMPY